MSDKFESKQLNIPSKGRINIVITTINDEGISIDVKLDDIDPDKFLETTGKDAINLIIGGYLILLDPEILNE